MSNAALNVEKVEVLIEAAMRFYLYDPDQSDPKFSGHEIAINEAAVVLLSSTLQTFFEGVFVECSEKLFRRKLSGLELKDYMETWSRWGNPSPANIKRLYRRLGIPDVLQDLGENGLIKEDFRSGLDEINQVRNRIAHGNCPTINGQPVSISLSRLRGWIQISKTGSKNFRFHALYCCGLPSTQSDQTPKLMKET